MTEYRKHDSKSSDDGFRKLVFKDIDLSKKDVLNLGCGNDYVDGWVNLDGDKNVKADIHKDLEIPATLRTIKDQAFDIIYAAHILEHIHNLVELKNELTRILKPGGIIIVIVPNYLSPDAWGDDTHCRAFSKESFLMSFWPGFINGKVSVLDIDKQLGKCQWLLAYLYKGE